MRIKAVIFDLDNTLYDEKQFVRSGFRAVSKHMAEKYRVNEIGLYELLLKVSLDQGRLRVFDTVLKKLNLYEKEIVLEMVEVYRAHSPKITIYKDAQEVLSKIKKKYRVGLITDGIRKVQESKVNALDIKDLFDTITYAIEHSGKINIQTFRTTLKKLNVKPSESIYVDDNPLKFRTARKLGIHAVRILKAEHRDYKVDQRYAPEFEITDLRQLSKLVRALNARTPHNIKAYCKRGKYVREVEDLSELYDEGYFHGDVYEDYSFQRLEQYFLAKIRSLRKYCNERGRLLDVGCALGYFVKLALYEGFDAYGIDFSEYAVEEATRLVGDRVVNADVEKEIPFENGYFDVVTAWDTLEHLRRPDLFLKGISRVLKENGLIFFTTVNYRSLMSRIMRERWRFIGVYHQSYTVTATDLRNWLNAAGFRVVTLSSSALILDDFSNKLNSQIARRMAKVTEEILRFQIRIMFKVLRPLNLGDLIFCVAKRVSV